MTALQLKLFKTRFTLIAMALVLVGVALELHELSR
jgi:hypothetical protein